jgi:hypothetical protein
MRAGGFDDPMFFFGTVTHPFSNTGFLDIGLARSVDVEHRFHEHLGVGLLYSHAPIGMTSGYREPLQYLHVLSYVNTVALTGSINLFGLRAAFGPAWHIAKAIQEEVGQLRRAESHGRFGFITQAGFQLPARSAVYLDARAQYSHVGRVSVGPLVSPARFGQPERSLPAPAVAFDHWLYTLGLGIRF